MTDSGSNHVILDNAWSDTNGAENEQPEPKSQTKVGDKRKLEYWSHYWDIKDPITDKVVKAKCKYCSKVLIANTENDGLHMVKDAITRICSAVRYVRSSPSRAKVFARSSMLVKVSCKELKDNGPSGVEEVGNN
ncbi:hypothetical protein V6N13_099330 [Hibiscus sabdariffa]